MELIIVPVTGDKQRFVVSDDMSVGEVRGVIGAMLDAPEEDEVAMRVNGRSLSDDEAPWTQAMAHVFNHGVVPSQVKVYCSVSAKRSTEVDSAVLRHALPSHESRKEELDAEREHARQMEPLIDQMSKNPGFVESMLAMQPGLKQMMDANPELGRQLRNPDSLKELMMSQLHPDRRREMGRSMELQLSQLSAIPGGQQMLERYTHGMEEDLERAQYGTHSEDDLRDTLEDATRPRAGQSSNSAPLPNPWASTAPPAQPTMPFGAGAPPLQNPFSLFAPNPPTAVAGAGGGAMNSSAPPNPFMNPAFLSRLMSATPPMSWGQGTSTGSTADANVRAELIGQTGTTPVPDFTAQMTVLSDMGFGDAALNRKALQEAGGDVEAAVLILAEQMDADVNDEDNTSGGNP